jgi:hypothetical protein
MLGMPRGPTLAPMGTPRDVNARYATISCIARLSLGKRFPDKLRVMQ